MISSEIQSLRSRPRFRKYYTATPDEILLSLEDVLKTDAMVTGSVATHHVFIRVKKEYEHFWSPQLGLEVEPHENGSMVRGLYGPKPAIWTMFVFFYAMLTLGTLAMFIWGISQQTLGNYPWALWFVPGGLLTIGGIYLLTQFGQKLSYPQMEMIHLVFEKGLSGLKPYHPIDEAKTKS